MPDNSVPSKGVTTIGILGHPESVCERYSDTVLYTSAEQKEYYFGSQTGLIGEFALIEPLTTKNLRLAFRRVSFCVLRVFVVYAKVFAFT